VVRESRGAPHGSHQRIGTRSVGEDPTVLTQRQGVCRSQIPKRSQRRGTTKEDIRVTRVRYPPRVPPRVHLVPVNRSSRSILPLWALNCDRDSGRGHEPNLFQRTSNWRRYLSLSPWWFFAREFRKREAFLVENQLRKLDFCFVVAVTERTARSKNYYKIKLLPLLIFYVIVKTYRITSKSFFLNLFMIIPLNGAARLCAIHDDSRPLISSKKSLR